MFGPEVTMTIYRDGNRALIDNQANGTHVRALYDIPAGSNKGWDADKPDGCSDSKFQGDWGEPFETSKSLLSDLKAQGVKETGAETVNGFRTKILETNGGAQGSAKVWVEPQTGLIIRAVFSAPDQPARTLLETKSFQPDKPPASAFQLPASCATGAPAVAGPSPLQPTNPDFVSAIAPGPSPGGQNCNLIIRALRADTYEPVTGLQMFVSLQIDVNNLDAPLAPGAIKQLVRPFRVDNAPAVMDVRMRLPDGAEATARIHRQCFASRTVLLLLLKNPARPTDGAEWVFAKSGRLSQYETLEPFQSRNPFVCSRAGFQAPKQNRKRAPKMIDREFYVNPYPVYQRLLEGDAMQPTPLFGGAWLCGHYKECVDLLRGVQTNSARADGLINTLPPEQRPEFEPFSERLRRWLIFQDGPAHKHLRKLLHPAFAPSAIAELRARISAVSDWLVDTIAQRQGGDLIRDLAFPLPTMVIAELVGVPAEERGFLISWTQRIADLFGSPEADVELARTAQDAMLDANAMLRTLIHERRKRPTDDLLSRMLRPDESGVSIDEEELNTQCVLLLLAGHETTRNLVGTAVLTLLKKPDAMQRLRNQPALLRSATEEALRFESPVRTISRVFVEDGEFAGVRVEKGQRVLTMLGAANRDPRQFESPNEFDIERKNNVHIAFGAGAHACMGSHLARLEAQVAIGSVVQRFPKLELTAEPEWMSHFMFHGLQSMPIAV